MFSLTYLIKLEICMCLCCYFFPLGKCIPSARSSLFMICGFGIYIVIIMMMMMMVMTLTALPDSYS